MKKHYLGIFLYLYMFYPENRWFLQKYWRPESRFKSGNWAHKQTDNGWETRKDFTKVHWPDQCIEQDAVYLSGFSWFKKE